MMFLLAAGELTYSPPIAADAPSMTSLVLRLFAMTAVGLAACLGMIWYARRQWKTIAPSQKGTGKLRHVADLPLDRRGSLHLLKVGPRKVVLGTDASGIKAMILMPESFTLELEPSRLTG